MGGGERIVEATGVHRSPSFTYLSIICIKKSVLNGRSLEAVIVWLCALTKKQLLHNVTGSCALLPHVPSVMCHAAPCLFLVSYCNSSSFCLTVGHASGINRCDFPWEVLVYTFYRP